MLYIENRPGIAFEDPILKILPAIDLTWLIFGLIYISLIAALISFSKKPKLLIAALQAYSLLIIIRIGAMFIAPFDPPKDMIPLNDPFIEFFATGKLLTKDLFFSGHTATLFLFFLLSKTKFFKISFLFSTIAVGILLLLQHVHYTIDVAAAPFFTYAAYASIIKFKENVEKKAA